MTKHIHICDRCGKEVLCIYSMPRLILEGLKINLYNDKDNELCPNCAEYVISEYHKLVHEKVTNR